MASVNETRTYTAYIRRSLESEWVINAYIYKVYNTNTGYPTHICEAIYHINANIYNTYTGHPTHI